VCYINLLTYFLCTQCRLDFKHGWQFKVDTILTSKYCSHKIQVQWPNCYAMKPPGFQNLTSFSQQQTNRIIISDQPNLCSQVVASGLLTWASSDGGGILTSSRTRVCVGWSGQWRFAWVNRVPQSGKHNAAKIKTITSPKRWTQCGMLYRVAHMNINK